MFTSLHKKTNQHIKSIWNYFKKGELQKINSGKKNYVSTLWQNDFDIVLSAVKNNCCEYHELPIKWRNNKKIRIAFLNIEPSYLRYFTEFQNDEEIVCLLLIKDPFVLQHASKRLQNKESVVRIAVTKNYFTLEYASEQLRNNRAFMLEMVMKYGAWSFFHVSDNLKNDWEFLLEALIRTQKKTILHGTPEKWLMNEDFVLIAAMMNYEAYSWIRGLWQHRANEIPPGLSIKLKKQYCLAPNTYIEGMNCRLYAALIELAIEKEKELQVRRIHVPARVYIMGAVYGLLNSQRISDKKTKTLRPLPHVPFEIATKISEFSAIYQKTSRATAVVNRCTLASAENALETARNRGFFNYNIMV